VATTSLSTACFGNRQYEDAAFQKCFSNLLAAPFRSFVVDVYLDAGRSVWSLCPVEIPPSNVPEVSTVSSASSTASNARRQDISSSTSASASISSTIARGGSSSASATATSSSTRSVESPPPVQFPKNNESAVLQIGNYNCTSTITLSLLANIFNDFLKSTDTTTDATLTYLSINLHAAASYLAPDAPAQQVDSRQIPSSGNLISDVMKGNLTDEMYTPDRLEEDRRNLNSSWYDAAWDNRPALGYYQTSFDSSNHLTTQDGWPTEAYMEFEKLFRLVASFGTIDPQISNYNLTTDLATVFPPGTIHDYHTTKFSSSGEITSGCLFSPSDPILTDTTNSSFALSLSPALNLGSTPNTTLPIPSLTNLTSCGLSPYLNTTLSNATADQNPQPYIAFARSAFWTWAPGSPVNTTNSNPGATVERCTTMRTSPYAGRWMTLDCTARHFAACQSPSNPYHWELSSSEETYYQASCPRDTVFSVPHTALENSYLLHTVKSHPSRPEIVYLNLNALDVPDCWVEGVNSTCPYISRTDTNKVRIVVVPTVAAVAIFLMAALTFFVKCAANRREDKRGRRRRNVGGWEYEGVPS
jgi:hypothetical protein